MNERAAPRSRASSFWRGGGPAMNPGKLSTSMAPWHAALDARLHQCMHMHGGGLGRGLTSQPLIPEPPRMIRAGAGDAVGQSKWSTVSGQGHAQMTSTHHICTSAAICRQKFIPAKLLKHICVSLQVYSNLFMPSSINHIISARKSQTVIM